MLTVKDLMMPEPLTVEAQESLRSAAELLTSSGISGAPVVSGDKLVGMISLADVLAFEVNEPDGPVFRPELSEPFEDLVPEEADGIGDASGWLSTLWEDGGGQVVSRLDHPETPEWDLLDEHTVSEVMSRVVYHVGPMTPITEAAQLMEKEHIHRVLVLDDEEPVGILTTSDIVRGVARGELIPAGTGPALVP